MKNLFFTLLGALLILAAFSCKKNEEVAVTAVSLSPSTASLIIGQTVQLNTMVLPNDATDPTVTWTSSNLAVATVSNSGLVTAVSEGSSAITASAGGKSAICAVTVSKGYVAVSSISLNKTEIVLEEGHSESLTATVNPADASVQTVTWSSSDSAVATVDDGGKVTAVAGGSALITATAEDKQATCKVFVTSTLSVGALRNDSPVMHAEGGSDGISIVGPLEWTATVTEGQPWCTVTQDGIYRLSISTVPNETGQERRAVIRVTSGKEQGEIEFYQVPQIRTARLEKTRRIRLTQKVSYQNRSMSLIWITLPYVESNEYQTIEDLQIGSGGKVAFSKDGYLKFVSFEFRPTERSGTVTGSIEYTAKTYYVSVDFSKVTRWFDYDTTTDEYKRFTGINEIDGKRYIDPENATLGAVADVFWEETGGNVVAYCRKCYDYVATAFTYQYGGNGIIADILANGGGDCGNISNLFLSMVRHKGIPARPLVMTQPHNENHVRTEFYLAGYGWIPVDPTYHMSGIDEFGKFTYNWVVSNRDEVFDWGIDGKSWKIDILQGCDWWWWCWSDGGEVTGSYDLSEIK